MDLRQLTAAAAAHKLVAVLGVAAAVGLAFLAQVRVDPFGDPMLAYRKSVVWSSHIDLQLTRAGFPEGQVSAPATGLETLAPLYSAIAASDPVKRLMRRRGPIVGDAQVEALTDAKQTPLPYVRITSLVNTASDATVRARRQARAFMGYISEQQQINHVPPRNRVILEVASGPTKPTVLVPRKVTLPIVVFLSVLIVTGALILALENLRRRAEPRETDATGRRKQLEAVEAQPATFDAGVSPADEMAQAMAPRATALHRPARTLGGTAGRADAAASVDGRDDIDRARESDTRAVSDVSRQRWNRPPRG